MTETEIHIQRGQSGIPLCADERPLQKITFSDPHYATCHTCWLLYFKDGKRKR